MADSTDESARAPGAPLCCGQTWQPLGSPRYSCPGHNSPSISLRSVEDSCADSGENGGPLHCAGQETQRATVKNRQARKLRIYHEWMDQQLPAVDIHMVTTAFTLDGYRIERNLGIVRGIIVRSRSILGTVGASLQTL